MYMFLLITNIDAHIFLNIKLLDEIITNRTKLTIKTKK